MPYLFVAAAAFLATYLCVPIAKRLAQRWGAIDYPSKRRINTTPIPRLGGLAVFAGLCCALIVETVSYTHLDVYKRQAPTSGSKPAAIIVAASRA